MNTLENRRVLLVDDTPAIHEDFPEDTDVHGRRVRLE